MKKDTTEIEKDIEALEARMQAADFWNDKLKAQEAIKKLNELKAEKEGLGKYDRGNAIISIVLVEVLPKFSKLEEKDVVIRPEDLKIEFSRAGGPGGQNVNKRETAVRIVHIHSNLAVHVSTERSQEQNRELALSILRA